MLIAKHEPSEVGFYSEDEVYAALRALIATLGTQKAAAESLEVTPQYLTDILRKRRNISKEFAAKLGFVPSPWPWVKKGGEQ